MHTLTTLTLRRSFTEEDMGLYIGGNLCLVPNILRSRAVVRQFDVVIDQHMGEHGFELVGSKEASGTVEVDQDMCKHNRGVAYQACRPVPKSRKSGLRETSWCLRFSPSPSLFSKNLKAWNSSGFS